MRAAILRDHRIVVDRIPDPIPQQGHMLCDVLASGICGSDLHSVHHGQALVRGFTDRPASAPPDPVPSVAGDFARDLVLGHEFCVEVIEAGPGVAELKPGDRLVSLPYVFDAAGAHGLGYSNQYPGGFAERMLISADSALPVPNGLDPRLAALTEPVAVARHAVGRSRASERHGAIVIGCGPIGLALVAWLLRARVEPVVAVDFSSRRRGVAARLGAHVLVDPGAEAPIDAWYREAGSRPAVLFEAVGATGVIDSLVRVAPKDAQLVIVGVCLVPDTFEPSRAFASELNIQFSSMYSPDEFAESLRLIAEGELGVAPIVTGHVGLDGVESAFDELLRPERHAKVLVEPAAAAKTIQSSDL